MADYEEVRRKKLEENKKRLEELNIGHLSVALRSPITPTKSPGRSVRKAPREELVVVRRSSRLANLPEQRYEEVVPEVELKRRRLVYKRRIVYKHRDLSNSHARIFSKHRDLWNRVYASDEAREYAQTKAEELESNLGAKFPSFVKPMLQSHTTGGFWLGLPSHFCDECLPKHDSTIVLIDEDGDEYDTNYLARKNGLSAGWRGFAIAHQLVDGDALVFELIKPTTFKVYIIRASGYGST